MCVTLTLARQRQVCFIPQSNVALLSCHGINAFSLFTSRHAPNGSPLNFASFRWFVILAWHTSQKGLGRSRKIGLFPFPHHKPYSLYLLPLAHDPTTSHIGWVQAGGAWALRVLSFQICPKVYLLVMHLLWSGDSPSVFSDLLCGLFFGFPLHSRTGLYLMMGLTFLWHTLSFLYFLQRCTVIPTVIT